MKYFTKTALKLRMSSHLEKRLILEGDKVGRGQAQKLMERIQNIGTKKKLYRRHQETIHNIPEFNSHLADAHFAEAAYLTDLKVMSGRDALKNLDKRTALRYYDGKSNHILSYRRSTKEIRSGVKDGERGLTLVSTQPKNMGSEYSVSDVPLDFGAVLKKYR